MAALIAVLFSVATVVIALALVPRFVERRVIFGITPDVPKPFGYRMSWLALKTTDTAAVLGALGLTDPEPANWNSGIGTIYDDALSDTYVFVAPPVKGWTLVAGVPLPHPFGLGFSDKLSPVLAALGKRFSDVQYYAAFPTIDYFGWARLHKGRLIRAFIIGEDGVLLDRGRLTAEEKSLGLRLYDLRGIKGRRGDAGGAIVLYPTEEQVLRLATSWGINPLMVDKHNIPAATGFIARAPSVWRAERVKERRAA